eukprot:comp16615_c0_seq1/m.14777 comp16615_c0_seq1/g.14777  ORF comp16615_c0_seq1/g.14777 comp16615_c0_seq1/m.14777 type:complete len:421 (-) comp16615_c0_seq1:102-1364(-)
MTLLVGVVRMTRKPSVGSDDSVSGENSSVRGLLPHRPIVPDGPYTLDELRERFVLKTVTKDGGQWTFSVEPGQCPMVLFANPKSGGNLGRSMAKKVAKRLHLHQCQLYFLEKGNAFSAGLQLFQNVPHTVVVMGGDGSVQWVMGEMDKIQYPEGLRPSLLVLPLGTGNDLARAMGCGGGITGLHSIFNILKYVPYTDYERGQRGLDRWKLVHVPDSKEVPGREVVFNNYFSIGIDAKVALKFDQGRRDCGCCYSLQTMNKLWYATHSLLSMCCNPRVADSCVMCIDGETTPTEIPRSLECLVFINIPSYAGGTDLWGSSLSKKDLLLGHKAQASNDGLLEIVGLRSLFQAGLLHLGVGHGVRVAQAGSVSLTVDREVYAQVDGEPFILPPGKLTIVRHNQYRMYCVPKRPSCWARCCCCC